MMRNKSILYVFLFLVGLSPLPFGMIHCLFQALFACCILFLVIFICVYCVKNNTRPAVRLRFIWPETVAFFLVILWGIIQVSSFSPESWHHPLWNKVSQTLSVPVSGSITLTPPLGVEAILRILTYGMTFWLSLQLARSRYWAPKVLWAISIAGTIYAAYGLTMYLGDFNMVLWVPKKALGNVTGTFINRNNFATYIGLCLLCAIGLYMSELLKVIYSGRKGRDKIVYILRYAFVKGAPLFACIFILFTALFLANSRGGVTASIIAVLILVVFLGPMVRMDRYLHKLLVVSILVAFLTVFFVSGGRWIDRLINTTVEKERRLQVYQEICEAIKISPWTGYGIGSFERTFSMFTRQMGIWDKGHNDWLEMMFELGIPMSILWFFVVVSLSFRCLIGFFRRHRDHVYPAVAFCASFLVGLHALVDFSLQIPAVAVTYTVILGTGVAQSWSSLVST